MTRDSAWVGARPPLVEILLSTYNGECYLGELLDSILSQTYGQWHMLIRDDGSTDSTRDIIASYSTKYPDRFTAIDDPGNNLGPGQSFGRLIKSAKASYLALCDQDDAWVPDKLDKQMTLMIEKQTEFGFHTPILVHSNLMVCDKNLRCVLDSFWKYQGINPFKMKDIRCLLLQNFVTGCTILMNRALAEKVIPIPNRAIMFDWWIALLANQLGRIETIDESLVKYRQHGNNTIGAKPWGFKSVIVDFFAGKASLKKALLDTKFQAKALLDRLDDGRKEDLDIISQYINMFEKQWVEKKISYLNVGMRKHGLLRQLMTWLLI